MKNSLIIISVICVSLISSCTNPENSSHTSSMMYKADSISESEYNQLLVELNEMFEEVYRKAECILDSGVNKKDLRVHLKYDSGYRQICSKAIEIDSLLTGYISSGRASTDFLREYKNKTVQASKKAQKTGLYTNEK